MNLRSIFGYLKLSYEVEDFGTIHAEIEKSLVFRGTNLWVLIFAIVVASVGLNVNSTAVIIGAMLISPLMGPINGIGYGIATYNYFIFIKALKNFGFAVAAGLITSTIYFAITPVSTAHSELLARTSPTIYDVLIAFFGGLAGIVAVSSKLKGNVIPGVAIATALMPPLCTAGYGLAIGNIYFFLGAFYLFTINSVFIALATLVVSRLLKFPIGEHIEKKNKQRIKNYITLVIVLTIAPSLYFGYRMVENEKFTNNASRFINDITTYKGAFLLKNKIDAPNKSIFLVFGGDELTKDDRKDIKKRLTSFELENCQLIFDQGFVLDNLKDKENLELKHKMSLLNNNLILQQKHVDSLRGIQKTGKLLLNEIKTIFPSISSCSFSQTTTYYDSTANENTKLIYLEHTSDLSQADKTKINQWLKQRVNNDMVKVIFSRDTINN